MKTRLKLPRTKTAVIALAVLLLAVSALLRITDSGKKAQAVSLSGTPVLVIDAGHGGIDGGALAQDGTKESTLNLAIAQKLSCTAALLGIDSVMTRTEDIAVTEKESYSERGELQYRAELINSTENAVYVSIHQNCYPTGQPSGPQVFYASDDASRSFGTIMQNNLISRLDEGNRRVAAPASERLYLCANTSCPGILVECGFMSNMWDVQKLCDEDYQRALAVVLAASFVQFCTGEA